ncbi:MAG: RNA polymerase sigma factor [Lachnospiraceae bacterium]|nr:RNA polymerase sigma factor [Clostridiales bacterium]MDD6292820.1 RNA polymerase sigma factor [Eubacteriales bacterium]MDY2607087.1 RNA polymerase sigma factor [Lachnospiraceae bacterium]
MTDNEMTEIYNRNVLSVYRLCFSYLKNVTDTEDIVQETFVKAFMRDKAFENERHEKGWLIMTAGNLCKDLLSHWWRKNRNLDDYETLQAKAGFDIDETFIEIMKLPPKYKTVIYMYYYEEYSTREISEILKKNKSTVCSLLKRGREILKERLGENNEE